jgi:hypothetical protein
MSDGSRMQKRCGKIAEKMTGKDGGVHLFLENDPVEYIPASAVNGTVPESGMVEVYGDFPNNIIPPHGPMPYFVFTDVCEPS